jgi:hypothetical protein
MSVHSEQWAPIELFDCPYYFQREAIRQYVEGAFKQIVLCFEFELS